MILSVAVYERRARYAIVRHADLWDISCHNWGFSMDQLSTAIVLTAFLTTCTTDVIPPIHEWGDAPCEEASGDVDTQLCPEENND